MKQKKILRIIKQSNIIMNENYPGCKYCNSFPNGLWNFVQSYLDRTDINKFQDRNVNQYYCNLITDFLNTEFHWENGKPTEYSYRFVRDLPDDMKAQAIDCLGTSLGWGPKYQGDGYISNAYSIFQKYFIK